jgi:hypothetical protein
MHTLDQVVVARDNFPVKEGAQMTGKKIARQVVQQNSLRRGLD